jgi:hypothetical protein
MIIAIISILGVIAIAATLIWLRVRWLDVG